MWAADEEEVEMTVIDATVLFEDRKVNRFQPEAIVKGQRCFNCDWDFSQSPRRVLCLLPNGRPVCIDCLNVYDEYNPTW